LVKRLLGIAAALLLLACASGAREDDAGAAAADSRSAADGMGEDTGDDALIVPEGLSVTALAGGNGVLEVIAFTLRQGPSGTEAFAALRNVGDVPACSAAVSIELFDKTEQSLAAGIGGLLTQRFYRLKDGSGSIAACVAPGDVTMAAVADLPSDLVIEDVGYVVYRCSYFALDVVPIAGLTISQLKSVTDNAGTAYTGTLINGLDVAVNNPSVTVFPVNRVGRPLGVATGSGTLEIPPGGSWAFETDRAAPGVDSFAYPAGALGN
jgi:hypothetical protein